MMKRVRAALMTAAIVTVSACSSNETVQEVTPKDLLARAETNIDKERYPRAIEELTQLSVDHPGVAFIDRVVYRLGEAYLGAGFYPDAEIQFARVRRDYPFSEFADEASYLTAETFYLQRGGIGNDAAMAEAALSRFKIFIREYPDSERASEARARIQDIRELLAEKKFRAAEQYFRHRRYGSTQIYCEIVVNEFPETNIVPNAWLLLARASAKLDDVDRACTALAEVGESPAGDDERVAAQAAEFAADLGCGRTDRASAAAADK